MLSPNFHFQINNIVKLEKSNEVKDIKISFSEILDNDPFIKNYEFTNNYFLNLEVSIEIYLREHKNLINSLSNKIFYKSSLTLNEAIRNLNNNIKNDKQKKVILFSPCAASFDQFKNFEERGKFFNKSIQYIFKQNKI